MAEAPPTYIQPMQKGWAHGQGNYKRFGLVQGEKSLFLVSCQDLFWGVLCWESIFCSKYVVNQLRPLDACQKDWQKETQGVTFQMRERGTRQNQMDKNLSWDRQWKREKTLGMPRCSGGRTHMVRRVVGISEGCLQQAKIISEQQGQKREIT